MNQKAIMLSVRRILLSCCRREEFEWEKGEIKVVRLSVRRIKRIPSSRWRREEFKQGVGGMDLLSVRRIRRLSVSRWRREELQQGGRGWGSEGSYALSEKNLIVSLPARRLGDKVVWLSVRRINRISSSRWRREEFKGDGYTFSEKNFSVSLWRREELEQGVLIRKQLCSQWDIWIAQALVLLPQSVLNEILRVKLIA